MTLLSNSHTYRAFLASVILIALVLSIAPHAAVAQTTEEKIPACTALTFTAVVIPSKIDIPCALLLVVDLLVDSLAYFPLTLANVAVQKAIEWNNSYLFDRPFLIAGWTVTRDVTNLFFVFILLWIALATIFDVQEYSAKNLLPRLIIVALLINFSLVIGSTVIKISNKLADVFWPEDIEYAMRSITAPTTQFKADLQTPSLPAQTIARSTEPKKDKLEAIQEIQDEYTFTDSNGQDHAITTTLESCKNPPSGEPQEVRDSRRTACAQFNADLIKDAGIATANINDGNSVYFVLAAAIFAKMIINPVAVFVAWALAVLLLYRFINLLFILLLGPFAFLGYIIPNTQRWWSEWWANLIKWSFFYPAFAIMFNISISIINAVSTAALAKTTKIGFTDALMNALLGAGMMLGSLTVAQKIGIEAANKFIERKDKLIGLAKRGALAPVRFAGAKAIEAGGKAMAQQLSKLQSTRFGQLRGVGKVLGQAQAGLKGVGPGEFGVSEAEFGRKYGTIMKGSDESIVKYAASIAGRNPNDSAAILNKLSVDKRRKGIGKLSGAEATTLGQHLSKIGADNLVRSASNNPETLVDLMQPEFAKNVASEQRAVAAAETVARNPNLPAADVVRAKDDLAKAQAKLKDAEKKRQEAIEAEFKMMNKIGGVSPEFINKMTEDMIGDLNKVDISAIGSSSTGAKALSQKIEELRKKARDSAYDIALKEATAAGRSQEDAIKAASSAAVQAHESMSFIKNPEARLYLNSSLGRVILRGGTVERQKSEEEKRAAAIAREIKAIEKAEGSAPGAQPPPPPKT